MFKQLLKKLPFGIKGNNSIVGNIKYNLVNCEILIFKPKRLNEIILITKYVKKQKSMNKHKKPIIPVSASN